VPYTPCTCGVCAWAGMQGLRMLPWGRCGLQLPALKALPPFLLELKPGVNSPLPPCCSKNFAGVTFSQEHVSAVCWSQLHPVCCHFAWCGLCLRAAAFSGAPHAALQEQNRTATAVRAEDQTAMTLSCEVNGWPSRGRCGEGKGKIARLSSSNWKRCTLGL
jgi:hypothetical protein